MNKFFDALESYFNEAEWLSGESCFDTNEDNFTFISEKKKEWELLLKDPKEHNIKISLKSSKVNLSCSCSGNANCEHIVAACIKVRKKLSEVVVAPSTTKKYQSKGSRSTISKFIEEIPHIELVKFLKAYSKKDKLLQNCLLVRFTKERNDQDELTKYEQILHKIIPAKTFKKSTLTTVEKQSFTFLLEEFKNQISDGISSEKYKDAVYQTLATYDKLYYVLKNYPFQLNTLLNYQNEYVEFIHKLNKLQIAPELKENLEMKLGEVALKSYFIPMQNGLIPLLADLKFNSNFENLFELSMSKSFDDKQLLNFHIRNLFILAAKDSDKINKIISKYLLDKSLWGLKLLINTNQENIIPSGLKVMSKNSKDFELMSFAVKYYLKVENEKEATKYFLKLLPLKAPIKRKLILFDIFSEEKQNQIIVDWNEEIKLSTPDIQIEYYTQTDQLDLCFECIYEHEQIDLLFKSDSFLADNNLKKTIVCYTDMLLRYLETHIGSENRIVMQKVLARVNSIGGRKASEKLKSLVKEKFAYRTT